MSLNQEFLKVIDLVKYFPIRAGVFQRRVGDVHAVDGISFSIFQGETFGLVGESGCGKSTAGRTIIQLYKATAGEVLFDGINLGILNNKDMQKMRRRMQIIFQDPYASLNPFMKVSEIVGESLEFHGITRGAETKERVRELLNTVKLDPCFVDRYPHEFSGGQRQRIGIARALALQPDFIVCDEPISALDVSIQAQIINLLKSLQQQLGLTYLLISHDLSMVRHISSRVGVMYLGKLVELADRNELYQNPLHPYARALLSAVPVPNPAVEKKRRRIILSGDVPSSAHPPSGCRFHSRCPLAEKRCSEVDPAWREVAPGHWVACILV